MVDSKIINALQDMISIEDDDECVDILINIRKADGSKITKVLTWKGGCIGYGDDKEYNIEACGMSGAIVNHGTMNIDWR